MQFLWVVSLLSKDTEQNCSSQHVIPHGRIQVPQGQSVSNMSPCCLTCNSSALVCVCLYPSKLSASLIGICFTSRYGFTRNPSPWHFYPRLPVESGHFYQHPLCVYCLFGWFDAVDNFPASQLKAFVWFDVYRLLLWRSYSFLWLKHRHW